MRRIAQIVAVAAVLLVAVEPALAGLSCGAQAASNVTCRAGCGMAMATTNMDCQTEHHLAGQPCPENCCNPTLPQTVTQATASVASKAGWTSAAVSAVDLPADHQNCVKLRPGEEPVHFAPSRHVLYCVFRI